MDSNSVSLTANAIVNYITDNSENEFERRLGEKECNKLAEKADKLKKTQLASWDKYNR